MGQREYLTKNRSQYYAYTWTGVVSFWQFLTIWTFWMVILGETRNVAPPVWVLSVVVIKIARVPLNIYIFLKACCSVLHRKYVHTNMSYSVHGTVLVVFDTYRWTHMPHARSTTVLDYDYATDDATEAHINSLIPIWHDRNLVLVLVAFDTHTDEHSCQM